ncbi:MAG: hypothetical protein RBT63_06630 [Bdellovibrionales bacterium]|jgi:hypothetical protein|nr:hypothetical protein [Bdellovibrionales bacterium]
MELMSPAIVDSEYQSDLLTYALSPLDHWRLRYATAKLERSGSFFLSAGSLSATQFDFKLRAELIAPLGQGPLSDDIVFRFLRTEDQNYEENSNHSIFELHARLAKSDFWVSAFGELTRAKKEDDVGFTLAHRSEQGEGLRVLRVGVTTADFTRTERNDAGDKFADGTDPVVWTFGYESFAADLYRELYVRYEQPVHWQDRTASQTYVYSHAVIGGSWIWREHESSVRFRSLRWQWDSKETSLLTHATDSYASRFRERHEVEWRAGHPLSLWGGRFSWEWGLSWVARHWRDEAAQRLTHQNLLPFLWFKHASGAEIGWETTFFRAYGFMGLASPSLRQVAEESRLNARYRYRFSERGEVSLALTLDVDRAEGGAFEGGHGQFTLVF